jgi:glycosyltransferase involved in cell wall biosynthesis
VAAPEQPKRSDRTRVLLAAAQDLSDPVGSPSRNSGLVLELGKQVDVLGSITPRVKPIERYRAIARHVHPSRLAWRQRSGLAPWTFERLERAMERELSYWPPDSFDVLMIFQTLFGPGRRDNPYAIYTDNIHTLTRRFLPDWAPLTERQRRRRIALERETCLGASRVFAMGEFLRSALIADYGCDPERVVWVGAGSNTVADSIEGKRYDTQMAIFVGLNFELKGGYVLLDAWSRVKRQLPDAELCILGPAPPSGVQDDPGVHWLGFIRDRDELATLYRRASLFVLPSYYDAYPHALREAMGQGLPCVGTARGGVPENISHGKTGLLVEPGDPDQLAEAMVAILADPDRAAAMGRAGYEEIIARHTWAHVAERIAPHLREIAAERRSAAVMPTPKSGLRRA